MQLFPATIELAREARFLALQRLQGGRLFGELAVGDGDARGFVDADVLLLDGSHHAVHLIFDEVGMDHPRAMLMPTRDGHLFDEEMLRGGGGGVLGDEACVELEEFGAVFVGEADGGGQAAGGG